MSDNPLADKRPDWEKFPKRWSMCDGGFVYYPGGSKHDELPEEVKEQFSAVPRAEPQEEEKREEALESRLQEAPRTLQDARGLINVRL